MAQICVESGKQCLTFAVARQRARSRRRVHNERVGEYRCRTCSWWHIGHVPKRPRFWRSRC